MLSSPFLDTLAVAAAAAAVVIPVLAPVDLLPVEGSAASEALLASLDPSLSVATAAVTLSWALPAGRGGEGAVITGRAVCWAATAAAGVGAPGLGGARSSMVIARAEGPAAAWGGRLCVFVTLIVRRFTLIVRRFTLIKTDGGR